MELKVRILRAFEPCSQPVACPRIPEGEGEGGGALSLQQGSLAPPSETVLLSGGVL